MAGRLDSLGLAGDDNGVTGVDGHDRRADGDIRIGVAENGGDGQSVVVELLGHPHRTEADVGGLLSDRDEGVDFLLVAVASLPAPQTAGPTPSIATPSQQPDGVSV